MNRTAKRTVWFIVVVILIGLGVAVLPTVFLQKLELVAEERLDLLASNDQSAETIGHLTLGRRVWVLACEDIHHYIVVKVRLDGNQVGYVHKGKFHLVRPPASSAWSAPVATGC